MWVLMNPRCAGTYGVCELRPFHLQGQFSSQLLKEHTPRFNPPPIPPLTPPHPTPSSGSQCVSH